MNTVLMELKVGIYNVYYTLLLLLLFNNVSTNAPINIIKNVKQSRYRPGVVQRVPGS
jgi:hypothetical protein